MMFNEKNLIFIFFIKKTYPPKFVKKKTDLGRKTHRWEPWDRHNFASLLGQKIEITSKFPNSLRY